MTPHNTIPQFPIDLWAALAIRKSLAGSSPMHALSRAGDSALAILARKLAVADPDERYQQFEQREAYPPQARALVMTHRSHPRRIA